MPFFSLSHKKKIRKKIQRRNYDHCGRLPNLQLLISLCFATIKRRKEGEIQSWTLYRKVYLAGRVLSVVDFRVWGLTSTAASCWEVEDCSSPALYGKDILGGGRGGRTHSSVGWSRWHRSSCVRHFSVFLFQSFPPSVDGCYFRLQRHVVFSDFL